MKRSPVGSADHKVLVAIVRAPLRPCRFLTTVMATENIEDGPCVDNPLGGDRPRHRQRRVWDAADRAPDVDQAGGGIDIRPSQREDLTDAQPGNDQQMPGGFKPGAAGSQQERVAGARGPATHCATPSHSSSAGTGTKIRRPSRRVGNSPRRAAS